MTQGHDTPPPPPTNPLRETGESLIRRFFLDWMMNQSGCPRDSLDALIYSLIHSACWKNSKTATTRAQILKSADCFCLVPVKEAASSIHLNKHSNNNKRRREWHPRKTHHFKVCKENKSGNKWIVGATESPGSHQESRAVNLPDADKWVMKIWQRPGSAPGKLRILWLCFGFYSRT